MYPNRKSLGFLVAASALLAGPVHAYGPNLLSNPSFHSGLTGWSNVYSLGTAAWSPSDADGAVTSGSALFTRSLPQNGGLGIGQCVSVVAGTSYVFATSAWILAGSPASQAAINAFFYAGSGCTGASLGSVSSGATGTTVQGRWVQLAGLAVAPTNAQSVLLELDNANLSGLNANVSVFFDNVFFGTGKCAPSPTQLCLNQGRFGVRATWTTSTGSGPGMAVPFAGDSGSFWFFSPTNIEMDVKVLNACVPALGNRYWVFAAGLTNVAVDLTVTDTETGTIKTYHNPQGQVFQPITDLNAFATCP
jgi:hypothetical protein